jgi:hypothetical protein
MAQDGQCFLIVYRFAKIQKNLIKVIIASGPEKPYCKRQYGMTEKGSFIRIGTASDPMPQKIIEELFALSRMTIDKRGIFE